MKALCTKCLGKGCENCEEGYSEASLESGTWYTRKCLDCGEENGVCNDDFLEVANKDPYDPIHCCVWCKGNNVVWKSVFQVDL